MQKSNELPESRTMWVAGWIFTVVALPYLVWLVLPQKCHGDTWENCLRMSLLCVGLLLLWCCGAAAVGCGVWMLVG